MKACCDAEALGEQLAEPLHAERLRRVVAGGEEVDPRLARLEHHALRGLTGQEGVQALGDRGREVGGGAAGDDSRSERTRLGAVE